ncbi:hypothetical protein FNH09_17035 [Streptomyces adustus]|uniref:Uncharacterized protein n=1 Tax=Streptomyces adustus TaxID=1609272 RepID=A0A5N8VFS7_9ACTN|nr:hypothetical protein [Streptomyces adustus]
MTPKSRRRVAVWSVIGWWTVLTGLFWLTGTILGQPASLAGCAASAVVLGAAGEAGDWIRRRWAARSGGRPLR